jgi:hypothetical protein
MKKLFALLGLTTALFASAAQAQTLLAGWAFEPDPLAVNLTNAVFPSAGTYAADNGGSGQLTAVHSATNTVWSSPTGNGSSNSLSANNWTTGDYFQFQFSTLTFSNIGIAWSQARSSTGATNFSLRYSTDGSSFTVFTNYSVLITTTPNAWSSASNNPIFNLSYDLSSITSLDNQTNVYLRLVSEQTSAAAGTGRIDNVSITAVPEPSTFALLALSAAGIGGYIFRRRRR